jgi:uncharacterized phage-associated protein
MTQSPAPMHTEQSPPYPALTIAKWLIAWAEAEGEELSNLKLQKLLYYAQGHHLADTHQPLFSDAIQAWSHGPVVPDVYHEYKEFGSASIVLPDEDPFTWDDVDAWTSQYLSAVWNTYGGYSAGWLRNMTHEERPWKDHFRPDGYAIVIPQNEIEKFFTEKRQA